MFILNQLYPRDDLKKFVESNQKQSGILYPKGLSPDNVEFVVITSGGRHGKQVGYQDHQNKDGSWTYYGQGGKGNQNHESLGNRMLLSTKSRKLLFSTREPTSEEVKKRGHYGKLYLFEGVFNLSTWSMQLVENGSRAGDRLIEAILSPADEIPHVAESISNRDKSVVQPITLEIGDNASSGFRVEFLQNHPMSKNASDDVASTPWIDNLSESLIPFGEFDAETTEDARFKSLCKIAVRRGQPKFRNQLLIAYGGKCAITGFDSEDALEAAHIIPYLGEHTNDVRNGLLLRADIHTLFDRGLIAINPGDMSIELSKSLVSSAYKYLLTRDFTLPADQRAHPDTKALKKHYEWAFGRF